MTKVTVTRKQPRLLPWNALNVGDVCVYVVDYKPDFTGHVWMKVSDYSVLYLDEDSGPYDVSVADREAKFYRFDNAKLTVDLGE